MLLDTNTLLLWLAYHANQNLIGHKRLKAFDVADSVRLANFIQRSDIHISLPNVLTEVSNFIDPDRLNTDDPLLLYFINYCRSVEEIYEPSGDVVKLAEFNKLGLSDGAILKLARAKTVVFTVDHKLYGYLKYSGIEAINLMHYKTPSSPK